MAEKSLREKIAETLRRELVRSEMTEQELADKLGITRTTLKRMLLGGTQLNFAQADRIAAAIGTRIDPVGRSRKHLPEKPEYMPIIEQVREAIKEAIYVRSVLQRDLADRTGIQPSSISDIVRGNYPFSARMGDTLLQGLNARVEVKLILDDEADDE